MLRLFVLLTAVVCCNAGCRKEILPTQDTTDSPEGCPDSDGNLHEFNSEWANEYETCVCGYSGIICCSSFGGYGPYGQFGGYGPFRQFGGYGPYGQFGGYGPYGQFGGYGPYGQFGGYGPYGQFGDYGPYGQAHGGHGLSGPTEYHGRGDSWYDLYGHTQYDDIRGNELHGNDDSTTQPIADDLVTDNSEPVK